MKAKRRRMKAAERLLFAMHIYPNYRVDSRGPAGCLFEALELIAPKLAKRVRESDAHTVHGEFFPNWDNVEASL